MPEQYPMRLNPPETAGGMTWQEVKDFLDHMRVTCVDERQRFKEDARRYRAALLEVERFCPCGARPESPDTHPHVTGCPVGRALRIDGRPHAD